MAIDDAARVERRKLGLGPPQHLDRGTVDQLLRGGRGPQHPIDEIVGPVGGVGDAVAVEIEGRVVAPVIAASALRPIEVARTDILDLIVVADEGVSGALRMADTGQDMIAWTVQAL